MKTVRNYKKWIIRFLAITLLVYLEFEISLYFTELPFDRLENHEKGYAIFDSKNDLIGMYTNIHGNYYIPYEGNISPLIQNGIQAVEDQRFLKHNGIDILAIFRASLQNLIAKKRVSGASTLTMQLIRLKTNNKRSWSSKIKESWLALKVERIYTKEKILQAYLNNAPFGANIYGIETAALYYFSKKANDLNADEVALLLGLPQSPSRLRPDRYLVRANVRKLFILKRMFEEKLISKEEYFLFSHQKTHLNGHFNSIENQAVPQIIKQNGIQGCVFTNIDSQLQEEIRQITENYFSGLKIGYDSAISVIEMPSGQVRALVEFNQNENSIYVLSSLSDRSTGSCLKPFIYGKAFEKGHAWPEMMVPDLPISINGYSPKDNDQQNYVKISIKDALKLSRNIPAVTLLGKIGLNSFNEMMKELNLMLLYSNNRAGLSSALGGLTANLLDLTNAYGVFAREGSFKPYVLLANTKMAKPKRIFKASTVSQVQECLIFNRELSFYAKTGTSWGPRDAWCIGYNKNYCIGVWIGKKDGGTMNNVSGEQTAYPLLCKLFSLFPKTEFMEAENENTQIEICNESGYRASQECLERRKIISKGLFLPPTCSLHKESDSNENINKKFNIIAPEMNASYLLVSSSKELTIECKTSEKSLPAYWFVNGIYKGIGSQQFLSSSELQNGENVVSSINSSGQSDMVKIKVKIIP